MSLVEALNRAIFNALNARDREPRYRVFRNNSLDYTLCSALPKLWRADKEMAYLQLEQLFGKGVCLVVNEIAKWNAELGRALQSDTQVKDKLASCAGLRIVDTYTFISSSAGWTAFGAHVDFEHSIILDVAGKGRDIYVWQAGKNVGQLKQDARSFFGISFDYYKHLQTAHLTTLAPGQIHMIPKMEPHVFHANGPGMFIGLSCVEAKGKDGSGVLPYQDDALIPFSQQLPT